MKNAVVAAIVAALVSSTATYAATRINGHSITPHSIPANRLTTKAVRSLNATPTPRALAAAVNSTLDYEAATGDITALPSTVTATCPAGNVAVGGGYITSQNVTGATITSNGKTPDNSGWTVTIGVGSSIQNDGNTPQLSVNVSCEPATP